MNRMNTSYNQDLSWCVVSKSDLNWSSEVWFELAVS